MVKKKEARSNMDLWAELLSKMPNSYKQWFAKEKEYLQEVITKDSKVLEVGCGDGRSIFDMLPITKNITGIDHDDRAVADALKNFKGVSSVKILKADATKLPFEEGSFDFVTCLTTFANFGDSKYVVLEEMKRVLKDDGKIIISVFSEDALNERMKVYNMVGVKIEKVEEGKVTFHESVGDNVSEQFSKKQLEEIFSKVGLKVEDMTKADIAYLCTLSKNKF